MYETLSLPEIEALARDCLTRAGVGAEAAQAVAREVTEAEAAGDRPHGLLALLHDLKALRYGHIHPDATSRQSTPRAGVLQVDARHGFAAQALVRALPDLEQMTRHQGLALLRLQRASPAGAMIVPITYLARAGFAALALDAAGDGRIAHPDHHAHPALEPETTPDLMRHWLGAAPVLVDDPFIGPAAHGAWILSADPAQLGDTPMPERLFEPPPPRLEEVTVPTHLLEQIIAA